MEKKFKEMYLQTRGFTLDKSKYILDENGTHYWKRLSVMDMIAVHHAFLKYHRHLDVEPSQLLTLLILANSICDKEMNRLYNLSFFAHPEVLRSLITLYNGVVDNPFFNRIMTEYSIFSLIYNYRIVDETKTKNKYFVDILANFRDKKETLEDSLFQIDNDVALFTLDYPHLDVDKMLLCEYALFYANLKMHGGVSIADRISNSLNNSFGMLAYLIEIGNTLISTQNAKKASTRRMALRRVKSENYMPLSLRDIVYELNNEIISRKGAIEKLRHFDNGLMLKRKSTAAYEKQFLAGLSDKSMDTYRKILLAHNRLKDWESVNQDYQEYKKKNG